MIILTAASGKKENCATCQHFIAERTLDSFKANIKHECSGKCSFTKTLRNANHTCSKWEKWNALK